MTLSWVFGGLTSAEIWQQSYNVWGYTHIHTHPKMQVLPTYPPLPKMQVLPASQNFKPGKKIGGLLKLKAQADSCHVAELELVFLVPRD